MLQQLLKFAIVPRLGADAVVIADSDVVLVRPLSSESLLFEGRAPLYRRAGVVDATLPRHVIWHATARRLLGLPSASPPLPDYISSFAVWETEVVIALQRRVERTTRCSWLDALGAQLHLSEFILYGVFVEEVLGLDRRTIVTSSRCHSYWETTPLDRDAAREFARGIASDDLAVMISAKSGTGLDEWKIALCEVEKRSRGRAPDVTRGPPHP